LDWACLKTRLLLQKLIEGRLQGKKTHGRPRAMLLDATMKMKRMRLTMQSSKKKHMTEKLGVTRKDLPLGRKHNE